MIPPALWSWIAVGLSAACYAAAFPTIGFRPAAWIALVPVLLLFRQIGGARHLAFSALWSEATSIAVAYALVDGVARYFERGFVVGWGFALIVWFVTVSIYYLAFTTLYRRFARHHVLWLPLLTGAAWCAAEFLRVRAFGVVPWFSGNPVGLLAYTQSGWLSLMQLASVTGPYGVSFLIAAFNAGVAGVIWAHRRGEQEREARLGLAIVVALVAACVLGGSLTVAGAAQERLANPALRSVAIVQGNADLGTRWRAEYYGRNLDLYQRESIEILRANPDAELLVWPEGALTFFLADEPAYQRAIGRLLAAGKVDLVVGGPRAASDGRGPAWNSVFSVGQDGGIIDHYDKVALLPFAEYLPFEKIDPNQRNFGGVRSFAPGTSADPLSTALGPAGILICNEAFQPEMASERVRAGAEFLINPTNDGWLSGEQWAQTTLGSVAYRAVEQRRYLVRASTSGPSAIIDPTGRVLEVSAHGTQASIAGRLAPRTARSLYSRLGDSFGWLCLAVTLAASFAGRASKEEE